MTAKELGNRTSGSTESRETEGDKELWARLDELEKEEEVYLAKEREEEERVAAMDGEEETTHDKEKLTARPTSDDTVVTEKKRATTEAKDLSTRSPAAANPLRITVKHTSSEALVSTEAKKVHCTDVVSVTTVHRDPF